MKQQTGKVSQAFWLYLVQLTHFSLNAPKSVITKQCRPSSDAAERQGLRCLH